VCKPSPRRSISAGRHAQAGSLNVEPVELRVASIRGDVAARGHVIDNGPVARSTSARPRAWRRETPQTAREIGAVSIQANGHVAF